MKTVNWKYSKLRPPNFPTIRIAQIAKLFHATDQLFEHVRALSSIEVYQKLFKVSTSTYWDTHYTFGKQCKQTKNSVGKMMINTIIINKQFECERYIFLSQFDWDYGKYSHTSERSLGIPFGSSYSSRS